MKAIAVIRIAIRATLLAFSIPALALPTLAATPVDGQPVGRALPSAHSAQAVPAALRPALYRALIRDEGSALSIGKNGCAIVQKKVLKGCFDRNGAHFSGPGVKAMTLHLVAYGRGNKAVPVAHVRPTFAANRVSYVHGPVTEWWRVLPRGFEQGFTLAKRPAGHGELTLALAASRQDAGAPLFRHSRESGNPVKNTLAWGKLHYGKLVVTDANGKVMPATLNAEDDRILIAVNDAHAAYPLTVDPLVWLEQKVTASDGVPNDFFGMSVAVSGTTALIGATQCFLSCNGPGAAYVFTKTNGAWTQTAKLIPSDGAMGDFFGMSVALDGATAVIGAPDLSGGEGAAYVFAEANGNWSQVQKLTASDGSADNYFGWSVSLSGATALVGSPGAYLDGNAGEGAAYLFTESEGAWEQAEKVVASDGAPNDGFGASVSLSGTTALVGAPHATVKGNLQQGAAYVFEQSGGSWNQYAKLIASDGAQNDWFGFSVSLSGSTALATAPQAGVNGNAVQGAAYVFESSNGNWAQVQKITASDGVAGDAFGVGGAIAGSTVLIAAPEASVNGNSLQGAAYLFKNLNGVWTEEQKITASDGMAGDQLGDSFSGPVVAVQGTTLVVGNPYTVEEDFVNRGAVYFYNRSDLGLAVSAPQSVGQGQQYVSQTIATNSASAASPAVSATIAVPAAASFVSATASQGSCSEASGVVTCDFGQIEANAGTATANVTLKATGAPDTTIENTAGIAKATPALTASAATEITSPGSCAAGYTEFDGHLDAGETFTSEPIEVTEAGQKYVDLTAPASFGFFAIVNTRYGQHTYVYPHVKHGHRWGAAGSYQVGVQAGPDAGGDYTLCVNLNPAQ